MVLLYFQYHSYHLENVWTFYAHLSQRVTYIRNKFESTRTVYKRIEYVWKKDE